MFCWNIYRRLWQVLRLEIEAPAVIAPGARVGFDVLTSGQIPNVIRLELAQGPDTVVLLEHRARMNVISALDPRIFRDTRSVVLTAANLERFERGSATLRVLGFGGQRLLRTPPTKVRELPVTVEF